MSSKSLPALIRELELRSSGIQNHLPELTTIGLTAADAQTCKNLALQLTQLETEQEALKAQLALKTAELINRQKEANQIKSSLTKRIKAAMEHKPEAWREFGIEAKR